MRLDCALRTVLCVLASIALTGCSRFAERTSIGEGPRSGLPSNFETLFSQNCSGCHGANGQGGASIPLSDPVYQSIVSDGVLRDTIANGRQGSNMPAFAQNAGGMLKDDEINALVTGMRREWAKRGGLNTAPPPPPYKAANGGDAERGAKAYSFYCAECHGEVGQTTGKAGSILDSSFLQLIDDQSLRTLVIVGRPEFQAPDWRANVPGHPMSDQEITDVVAFLSARRPQTSGASGRQGGQ